MKELRFDADDRVWRAAFALAPKREAIFLVAADKSGSGEKKFYKRLIKNRGRKILSASGCVERKQGGLIRRPAH